MDEDKKKSKDTVKNILGLVVVACLFVTYCTPEPKTAKEKLAEAERRADYNRRLDVIIQCQDLIRAQSKFPSKVKFPTFGGAHEARLDDDSQIVIIGKAELMNGFGAMIPHQFACRYDKKTQQMDPPIMTVGG